jgi:hypothetical protein
MKTKVFLLFLPFFVSCATAAITPTQVNATLVAIELGQAFVLQCCSDNQQATGQHQASNTTVQFMAVRNDSRCPYDVDCFWAGDATVELKVNGKIESLHTGLDPRSLNVGQYRLSLQKLVPEPGLPGPMQVTLLLEAQ